MILKSDVTPHFDLRGGYVLRDQMPEQFKYFRFVRAVYTVDGSNKAVTLEAGGFIPTAWRADGERDYFVSVLDAGD